MAAREGASLVRVRFEFLAAILRGRGVPFQGDRMSYRLGFRRGFFQWSAAALTARGFGGAVFLLALSHATTAQARTITVDLFNERAAGQVGQCTLREAVQAVNFNTAIQGCRGPDGQP